MVARGLRWEFGVSVPPFEAPWWLRGANRQTLFASKMRSTPPVAYEMEEFQLSDGDFVDLAWTGRPGGALVVVLHGLEGSHDSIYVRGLLNQVTARGWRGVVLNFRGCSGRPNRLDRAYHSGDTGDIDEVMSRLLERPELRDAPVGVVGYSLGGNVLVKWLGERGGEHPARCAVAVSVPYELATCAERMSEGFSRVYQAHLLRSLKRKLVEKLPDHPPMDWTRTFWEWDEHVTAPLHDFDGADDYYARCSSRPYVGQIRVPSLLLHAADDPFMRPTVVPQAHELPAAVSLEVSAGGGHVGFVYGSNPLRPRFWLEERIPAFLEQHLQSSASSAAR